MKSGIMVAGTILVDRIKQISKYPKSGELTKIKSTSRAVGGCVPNVAADLKLIDKSVDIFACGKVGTDDDGTFVKEQLRSYNVNVDCISNSAVDATSFTDVMSIVGGERTFFTYAGASADFGDADVPNDFANAKMLHLGYFLLLNKIDEGEGEKILKRAKDFGVKTSIDLVSENSDRYKVVLPCLKYTDNLIVNEIEAGKLAGIEPKRENLKSICEKLKSLGVKERVIIHLPECGVCYSKDGFTVVPSLSLPIGYIKGSTGAGDAFCAGALIGIYHDMNDREILEFGSSCAAVSLRVPDAVSGLMDKNDIKEFCSQFERRNLG